MGSALSVKHSINLAIAKQIAAAAEAEAVKNNWLVVITLVDAGGHLVYMQRLDDTQHGSVEVSLKKAQTAVAFKRPTKIFEDAALGGRNVLLSMPIIPIEGGLPLIVDGKIVGAIGVSGVTAQQDGQIAKAGADALPKILGG